MFVSYDPDLGFLAHGCKERGSLLNPLAEVLLGPYDRIEFPPEIRLELLCRLDQAVDFHIADDEHINVTSGVVVAAGIRTEDESEPNALVRLEERSQLRHDSNRARVEVAKRQIQRM